MAGSPQGLQGDGTILAPQERGWDQAWPGLVKSGDCCHPCYSCGAVLGRQWPNQPILVVTASLREEQGTSTLGGTGEQRGEPPPLWVLPALLSPQKVSGVPGLSPHRCPAREEPVVPHPETRCPSHGHLRDTGMSLLWTPHRLLHRTCTKSVAGDRDAPSLESRWMWRYPGDRRGLSGWQGAVPMPGGQQGGSCTHLGACWAGAV